MRAARHAGRPLGVAVVTALVTGGVVLAGAGSAAAADPPENRLAVSSHYENQVFDLITDDAVYIHETVAGGAQDIYRLPLTVTATGTTVGAPQFVGSAIPGAWGTATYAEHDGTVAYPRAGDGALVLRAPDGTEDVLDWYTPQTYGRRVSGLTANWVVIDYGGGEWLYDIHTGAQMDLLGMADVPPTAAQAKVLDVVVTDERVAWNVVTPSWEYMELLTVALDSDGTSGAVTSVGRVVRDAPVTSWPYLYPHLMGDSLVWMEQISHPSHYSTNNLKWRSAAPYDATPGSLLIPDFTSVRYTETDVVFSHKSYITEPWTPQFSSTWRALSAPSTVLHSTGVVTGEVDAAAGTLFVYTTGDVDPRTSLIEEGTSWLADVTGRPVRAVGWIPPITFTDVRPEQAFGTEIMWLAREGLTYGYADGTFRRLGTVNRDAMAAFLYRLTHDGADAPDCSAAAFADVPASHPFCGEIDWLAETGITTGWPDGTFRPGQPVTREAMAAFLFRLHRIHNPSTPVATCTSAPFTDVPATHPFCGPITWLADSGVSVGWADGTFRPGDFVERQAMAAFLYRFVNNGLLAPPR